MVWKSAERWGPAIDSAACAVLNAAGFGAIEAGVGAVLLGGVKAGPVGAIAGGALALYAANIACTYDTGGTGPTGGTYCGLDMNKVCLTPAVGNQRLYYIANGEKIDSRQYGRLLSIGCAFAEATSPDSQGLYAHYRSVTTDSGPGTEPFTADSIFYLTSTTTPPTPPNPDNLILYSEDVPIDGHPGRCDEIPRVQPIQGVDGNNCNITTQMVAMGATPGGNLTPIMLIEPGHLKQEWEDGEMWKRDQPGTIGSQRTSGYTQECNFTPFIALNYGDNYYSVPIEPGEDFQDALDRLNDDLSGQINEVSGEIGVVDEKVDDILDKLPENGFGGPIDIPSGTVTFRAVCNLDPQGNPEEVEYQLGGATTNNMALMQIYSNQTKLFAMIQQHLIWKTPICSPTPAPITGHLVSIHFESLENSPNSERPLRKLFRYRSQSSRTLAEIAAYWKGFQWQAGPFCVGHTDAAWGTVQVWAQSVGEGQRVIRKAGTEAGIDPDTSGEWRTGSSDDPRYGMPGTMRIQRLEDGDWITSRRGPSGLPLYTVDP